MGILENVLLIMTFFMITMNIISLVNKIEREDYADYLENKLYKLEQHNKLMKKEIKCLLEYVEELENQNDKINKFLLLNDKQWQERYEELLKKNSELHDYIENC